MKVPSGVTVTFGEALAEYPSPSENPPRSRPYRAGCGNPRQPGLRRRSGTSPFAVMCDPFRVPAGGGPLARVLNKLWSRDSVGHPSRIGRERCTSKHPVDRGQCSSPEQRTAFAVLCDPFRVPAGGGPLARVLNKLWSRDSVGHPSRIGRERCTSKHPVDRGQCSSPEQRTAFAVLCDPYRVPAGGAPGVRVLNKLWSKVTSGRASSATRAHPGLAPCQKGQGA
ncbi:hypothetical protein SCOR_15645 [Sulfidibacter corallicola]